MDGWIREQRTRTIGTASHFRGHAQRERIIISYRRITKQQEGGIKTD